MTNNAMNNSVMGEAYIRTFIALKESDKFENVKTFLQTEYLCTKNLLENNGTLAINGYTFSTREDMIKAAMQYMDSLKVIGKIMGVEYEE